MKILGMGMPELIIILCVVLLIFGPKNLPKLGNALGKTVKGLREGMSGEKDAVADEDEDAADEPAAVKAIEAADEDEAKPVAKKRVKKVAKAAQAEA